MLLGRPGLHVGRGLPIWHWIGGLSGWPTISEGNCY